MLQPSTQEPCKQTLSEQTLPHAPQLLLSVKMFMHPWSGQAACVSEHGAPTQIPSVQLSPVVKMFPSLQAVPLALTGPHKPLVGSHVLSWRQLEQGGVGDPVQVPVMQVELGVHRVLPLQSVPSAAGEVRQPKSG